MIALKTVQETREITESWIKQGLKVVLYLLWDVCMMGMFH